MPPSVLITEKRTSRKVSPSSSNLIEVVATVINPERQRWGDTVLAEVDCNGENRKSNDVLFDQLTPEKNPFTGELSPHSGVLTFKGPSDDPVENPNSETILLPNRTYRFFGKVTQYKDKKTGENRQQFTFQTFVKIQPHGQAGVIRYLMDLPHIGRTTAAALWEKFQGQAVRILRESPEVAAVAVSLTHFTEAKAIEAATKAREQQAMEACTIDLLDLLTGRGFPKATAQSLVRRFGNRAAHVLKNDPWKLRGLRGCGFRKVDKLAMDQGLDPDRLKRQALAALHVLESNKSDTWMSVADVLAGMMDLIAGAVIKAGRALRCAKLAGLIVVRADTNGVKWIAERRRASQEQHIAAKVAEMCSASWQRQWPEMERGSDNSSPLVSTHQLAGLIAATRKPIGIFQGGPGTGKSYTTCQFIKWLESKYGSSAIAICAPTGKASGRLNNELSHYGCATRAKTVHSLLGLLRGKRPKDKHGEFVRYDWETKFVFEHGPEKVLPFRFLFIDEGFMPSTDLLCSILMAVGRHTQVMMIGDPQQLPPIDHGRPALDLARAGVPRGLLTEPQRNAGTIVFACKDIATGRPFRSDTPEEFNPESTPPRNLEMVECATSMMQHVAAIKRIAWAASRGLDPIWDVQLIIAVNNNSPLCRKKFNTVLQAKLNPTGRTVQGNPFREGDKVVCTENGSYRCENREAEYADENGEVRCDNGDIGKVIHVESNKTTVEFFGPSRRVVFSHYLTGEKATSSDRLGESGDASDTEDEKEASDTGCPLVLNYAGTCHGMQGSEAKYVIVMIDEYHGAKRICSCEWFVTGISRGKWATSIIGKQATAQAMCLNKAVEKRKTFLKEILVEKLWGDL